MSLRSSLVTALAEATRGTVRGAQRGASHAYDRLEGGLLAGAQTAPFGLVPWGGAALLTGGAFGNEEALADGAVMMTGGVGALGAVGGALSGRRQMLRGLIGRGPKALAKYIRYLKRIGLHEEAAQVEVAKFLRNVGEYKRGEKGGITGGYLSRMERTQADEPSRRRDMMNNRAMWREMSNTRSALWRRLRDIE